MTVDGGFVDAVARHVEQVMAARAAAIEAVLVEAVCAQGFDQLDRLTVVYYPPPGDDFLSPELWGVASWLGPEYFNQQETTTC